MKRKSAEIYGATATNEKRTTARKCGGKMDVMTRMMTDVRGQVSDIRPMTGTCPRATVVPPPCHREQQLIDYHGGIGSYRVANKIRGVSKFNPGGRLYHQTSNWFFGNIAPYTGY